MKPRELSNELEHVIREHEAIQIRIGYWVCSSCKVRWPCLDVQLGIINEMIRAQTEPIN